MGFPICGWESRWLGGGAGNLESLTSCLCCGCQCRPGLKSLRTSYLVCLKLCPYLWNGSDDVDLTDTSGNLMLRGLKTLPPCLQIESVHRNMSWCYKQQRKKLMFPYCAATGSQVRNLRNSAQFSCQQSCKVTRSCRRGGYIQLALGEWGPQEGPLQSRGTLGMQKPLLNWNGLGVAYRWATDYYLT